MSVATAQARSKPKTLLVLFPGCGVTKMGMQLVTSTITKVCEREGRAVIATHVCGEEKYNAGWPTLRTILSQVDEVVMFDVASGQLMVVSSAYVRAMLQRRSSQDN